jgi:hypothetical protein
LAKEGYGNWSLLKGNWTQEDYGNMIQEHYGNMTQEDYGNWTLFDGNWTQEFYDYGNWSLMNGNGTQEDYDSGNWSQERYRDWDQDEYRGTSGNWSVGYNNTKWWSMLDNDTESDIGEEFVLSLFNVADVDDEYTFRNKNISSGN